ncbi:MAG: hypothetical protein ACI8Z5_001700, partial [Lentimonas sp.]
MSLRRADWLVEVEARVIALEALRLCRPCANEVFSSGLSATLADLVPPCGAADMFVKQSGVSGAGEGIARSPCSSDLHHIKTDFGGADLRPIADVD